MAVAPADDEHALRAWPVRRVVAAALLGLLLAGGCARPAERDETAAPATTPTTTTPPTTGQDTEALRRAQLEVERFCMTGFPDHTADAAYSFKYLEELGRRILTEQVGKGVNIREVGPQADGSGVRVVTPDARRVREQLQQRYGKALIVTEGP
jgi:hypothetical protein